MSSLIDGDLLAIMQCIRCGGALRERFEPPSLVCDECHVWYPVEDGIPAMLEDEIRSLDEAPGDGR
ncbi:MAG: Trm112 family protein [Acidimicrobiia bacterium]